MHIKLWGTRGSLPTPLTNDEYHQKIEDVLSYISTHKIKGETPQDTIKQLPSHLISTHGGNTTSLSIRSKLGSEVVIDAGTGIFPLGKELMEGTLGKGKGEMHLFFTHTHWDHIQGLPFFKPLYIPGNQLFFVSPMEDLYSRLVYQQNEKFFPLNFDAMLSTKIFSTMVQGERYHIDDSLSVDFFPLSHPGSSYAYRFIEDGNTFIFATDVELHGESFENASKEQNDFFSNADILILDAQYTLNEAFEKLYWGHTSHTMAINCGINWKVKKLLLTHHDPAYDDNILTEMNNYAKQYLQESEQLSKPNNIEILFAKEGMTFEL